MIECPFPYFGGKSRCADLVWDRFGDVPHYVEPFFGSGAVLFARPTEPRTETVNDIDGYIANFWRAVNAAPDEVAEWMNWPVNEIDLEARHRWLVQLPRKTEHLRRMKHEPDYYDAQIAGWWCWGLAQWIGGGWCGGEYVEPDHADNHGAGICNGAAKRPHLGNNRGVHRQLPHLGNAGMGVHRQLPHLGNAGMGECERRGEVLRQWMSSIADRLRNVRVCCGDWSRVVGSETVLTHCGSPCGVFLDPPYSKEANRDNDLYREDNLSVAHDVREWCIANGNRTDLRIALCGYDGEHDMPDGWECVHWKARGGYAQQSADPESQGKINRHMERIWFSPHCLKVTLFT